MAVRHHQRRSLARAVRAPIEALERRTLLAAVNWINGAGGDFNNPANWDTNTVPTAGDDASITLAGTYTVTLAGSIVSLNSLTLGNASSGLQTLQVDGTSLTLAAASSVTARGILSFGNTTIGGATLTNSGQITARGTDAINSTFASNLGSVLRVQGNATDGSAALTVANGFTSSGQIQLTSAGGAFDSTLSVSSGTLVIPLASSITAAAGTGGNRTLNATASSAGTITIQSPLAINGASLASSGVISLTTGDLTVNEPGGSFTSSGPILVPGGRTLTVTGAPLTQSGGTFTGSGTINANVTNSAAVATPTKYGTGIPAYYEAFNYSAGSQLQGQGGWTEPGYNDSFGKDFQTPELITSAGMSYPNLVTGGRAVQTSGIFSYDNLNFGPSGFIGGNSGTFWFGFLIRQDTVGNNPSQNGPDYGGLVLGNGPDANNVLIGKPGGGAGVNNWSLDNNVSTNQASSSVPVVVGQTTFLVAKVQFAPGLDTITLYVNPTPGAPEGSLVAAATLNAELFAFNQIAISTGANAHWTLDEIRISTTFADVAPRASAQMTINGNYTQSGTGVFVADVTGPNVDTQYDQLVVNGTVAVGGPLIVQAGGLVPGGVQTFTLIDNDGADAVTGTFTGLAEGTIFQANGRNFRVSYVGGSGNDVTITYLPTITINDITVSEASSTATFTVTLSDSSASASATTVQWATSDGTATAGNDYTAASGTVTFDPGVTSQQVVITLLPDTLDEVNETFNVNLSTPTNGVISDNLGVATITDDDPPPTLSVNDVTVSEGNSGTVTAGFTISLSAISAKTVTVLASTANSNATSPSDYTAITNQLITFLPGDTSKPFNVTVNGDTWGELNETYFVNLSSPSNATLSDGQGVGTITDDDPPMTAAFATVSPDPRSTALSSLAITFTEPVTGFDKSDLTLTRDGSSVSLSSATLTSSDNITWTLGNLSSATGRAGTYVLTLTASGSGIGGGGGGPLTNNPSRSWQMNTINGTAGSDVIALVRDGTSGVYKVFINNATATPDYSVNAAAIGSLFVSGNGGNDQLLVTGASGGGDAYTFSNTQFSRTGGGSTFTFSGITTLGLASGTFDSTADLAGLSVIAGSGGLVRFNSTQHLGDLNLGASGTVRMVSGGDKVLVVTSLTFGGGKLDLTDEDLILNYSSTSPLGTWTGSAYDGVTGAIATGRNGGAWNGASGIITSSASGSLTTLGVSEAAQKFSLGPTDTALFDGQTVDSTAVLVKFTYGGDANLDGKLDVDDYGRIDFNVPLGTRNWFNGDFNYDGVINVDDYGIVDFNIGIQGGIL